MNKYVKCVCVSTRWLSVLCPTCAQVVTLQEKLGKRETFIETLSTKLSQYQTNVGGTPDGQSVVNEQDKPVSNDVSLHFGISCSSVCVCVFISNTNALSKYMHAYTRTSGPWP